MKKITLNKLHFRIDKEPIFSKMTLDIWNEMTLDNQKLFLSLVEKEISFPDAIILIESIVDRYMDLKIVEVTYLNEGDYIPRSIKKYILLFKDKNNNLEDISLALKHRERLTIEQIRFTLKHGVIVDDLNKIAEDTTPIVIDAENLEIIDDIFTFDAEAKIDM